MKPKVIRPEDNRAFRGEIKDVRRSNCHQRKTQYPNVLHSAALWRRWFGRSKVVLSGCIHAGFKFAALEPFFLGMAGDIQQFSCG